MVTELGDVDTFQNLNIYISSKLVDISIMSAGWVLSSTGPTL